MVVHLDFSINGILNNNLALKKLQIASQVLNRDTFTASQDVAVEVILLTGRPESVREATELWLAQYHIEYDQLIMRNRSSHYLKAVVYKEKVYKTIIKSDVFCAYDDEEEIIQMWNGLGIPAFKVYVI